MNAIRALSTAALFLLPLLVFVPPTDAFTPSGSLSGIFLRPGEGGAVLGFGPVPDGETSTIPIQTAGGSPVAGAPPVCVRAPPGPVAGTCTGAVLGIATSPATFAINGTGAMSLWLSTTSPTPIALLSVTGKLQHVNSDAEVAEIYRFESHRTSQPPTLQIAPRSEDGGHPAASTILTLTETPTRIALSEFRASPAIVFAGDALTLAVELITPVSGPADLQIVAHYGAEMPSGVIFQLDGFAPRAVRLGTTTLPIYPAGNNVTFHPRPSNATEARTFPTGAPPAAGAPAPPTTAVTGSTITFGPTLLDEGTLIVGDGVVEFFVGTAEAATGPAVDLAFDVKLTIGDKVFSGVTNTMVHQPSLAGTRFVVPLHGSPGLVLADDNVTLSITIWAPKTDNFRLIFGSAEHPTGIHLPVFGGGSVGPPPPPAPVPTASSEPSEPEPEPSSEPAEPNEPSPSPDPNPSVSPSPSASDEPQEDATILETKPTGTPGVGFAVLAGAVAALAVASRGRVGKGS